MPSHITPEMAEFYGIYIGDGNIILNKKRRQYRFKISSNKNTDYEYVKRRVQFLINKLFKTKSKIYLYKNMNYFECYFYSKKIIEHLVHLFELDENDVRKDRLSNKILKNDDLKKYFLRGLFDTDGTIYKKYGDYAQIGFRIYNASIFNSVLTFLDQLEFNPSANRGFNYVYIHSQKEIRHFFRDIGSANPKHIARYLYWKNFSEVPKIEKTEQLLKNFDRPLPFFDR
jgi:DNA-binding transcriptional regulator WhiA